jgi:hypothetical protein
MSPSKERKPTSKERPREWFVGNGLAALGAGVLMMLLDMLAVDTMLIWMAGAAGDTGVQGVFRFVFTDLMPVFFIVGGFGAYLFVRGLNIEGDTSRITEIDLWVVRICSVLVVAYLLSIIVF